MKCNACGYGSAAELAQCPSCKRFGTFARWQRLAAVKAAEMPRLLTGIGELDALLGGGLVKGCAYQLWAEPGTGKSTLALDLATRVPAFYATSEEQQQAIRLRAARMRRDGASTYVAEVSAPEDLADLPADAELVVIDSANRLRSRAVGGRPGSNEQLRHAYELAVTLARETGRVVLVVAQVNADGEAAGTTEADHIVDGQLEMLKPEVGEAWGAVVVHKHRHGPAPAALAFRHVSAGLEYRAAEEIDHEAEDQAEDPPKSDEPVFGAPGRPHAHRPGGPRRLRVRDEAEEERGDEEALEEEERHEAEEDDDAEEARSAQPPGAVRAPPLIFGRSVLEVLRDFPGLQGLRLPDRVVDAISIEDEDEVIEELSDIPF